MFGLPRLWPIPEISSSSAGNRVTSCPGPNEAATASANVTVHAHTTLIAAGTFMGNNRITSENPSLAVVKPVLEFFRHGQPGVRTDQGGHRLWVRQDAP